MENLNRVLLENVLPAHVAEHFLARSLKNEVRWAARGRSGSGWAWRLVASGGATVRYTLDMQCVSSPPLPRGRPDVFHFKRMLTIHRDIRGSEEMYPGY